MMWEDTRLFGCRRMEGGGSWAEDAWRRLARLLSWMEGGR